MTSTNFLRGVYALSGMIALTMTGFCIYQDRLFDASLFVIVVGINIVGIMQTK